MKRFISLVLAVSLVISGCATNLDNALYTNNVDDVRRIIKEGDSPKVSFFKASFVSGCQYRDV